MSQTQIWSKALPVLALTLAAMIGLPAYATTTTVSLGTVYTGSIPDGTGPWLTAEFQWAPGSSMGTLTLSSNLTAPDFLQGQSGPNTATGWSFFINQPLASTNFASCTPGTTCASGVSTDTLNKAGPVSGPFNLTFGWSHGNRFSGVDTATYDLTFASALTNDSPFVVNTSGWSSVAHIQGIYNSQDPKKPCSGWIVSGKGSGANGGTICGSGTQSVPEPAELGMFGLGLLLIGLFVGLRRQRP